MIDSVFDINEDINLILRPDNTLTKDSLINAYTPNPYKNGSSVFIQETFFNPWVFNHSAKEYIASTIIHEGIHAVLSYYQSRYKLWLNGYTTNPIVDSNFMKQHFPIYWDYKRSLTGVELAEHEQMAQQYVSMFKEFVKEFNSSVSDTMATALAWKGLQGTSVWKTKSDSANLISMQRDARRDLDSTKFNLYNLTICQ